MNPWIDAIFLSIACFGAAASMIVIYMCIKALITKEYF